MKSQYLLSLSTSLTVALGIIATSGNSVVASEATFHCQSTQEIPTTVAKSDGAEQPIFHWNLDKETVSDSPEELCNSVTEKLNNYISEGNNLSPLIFKATRIFPEDPSLPSLPGVCLAGEDDSCSLDLFALESSQSQEAASLALNSILDPALQSTPVEPKKKVRGFQSTSYKVNFWDLFVR